MDTLKARVYRQGASTYVIGTRDMQLACAYLGISAETHCWGSTVAGLYVRRQGTWREANGLRIPKDAKPAVVFVGQIRPITEV